MAGMDHWQESIGRLLWDREIPLPVCVPYTLFVCILVPVYWRYYGPANFLWFSDLALLITLAALWLESPLLTSMQAVSVGLLELVWIADFVTRLVFGVRLVGMTDYMFKAEIPLLVRGLSLFHVVLPFLLFWLVYRLGYDKRAWMAQTLLGKDHAFAAVFHFFGEAAQSFGTLSKVVSYDTNVFVDFDYIVLHFQVPPGCF